MTCRNRRRHLLERQSCIGKLLSETPLAALHGVGVVGVWERGEFERVEPGTRIGPHTMLVLAGTAEALAEYDALFAIYNVSAEPVVVVGGGSVGRATARALERRGIDYRIVDRGSHVLRDPRGIQGDAADIEVLERAGIRSAPVAVITTHDDDTNVFLTLYCRKLRPEMQIVSRATLERNVETMHRAGADSVVSLTSMGANAIFNVLERGEILTVSEGLNMFRIQVPRQAARRAPGARVVIGDSGCSLVAVIDGERITVSPGPDTPLPGGAELVLIGSSDEELRLLEDWAE